MDTNEIGAIGFTVALIVFALLTILLWSGWRRSDQTRLLVLATGISMLWAGVWTAGFLDLTRDYAFVASVEWARGIAWLLASLAILREVVETDLARQLRSRKGVFVLLLAGVPVGYFLFLTDEPLTTIAWYSGGFVLSLFNVLIAEQLYRNAPVESRSGITYLCIAIVGAFLFDLIMYGLLIAGFSPESDYWAARGFINVLLAPPLVLGIWRRSHKTPSTKSFSAMHPLQQLNVDHSREWRVAGHYHQHPPGCTPSSARSKQQRLYQWHQP